MKSADLSCNIDKDHDQKVDHNKTKLTKQNQMHLYNNIDPFSIDVAMMCVWVSMEAMMIVDWNIAKDKKQWNYGTIVIFIKKQVDKLWHSYVRNRWEITT